MPHLNLYIIGRMHVKNLSGQMRRSLPHFDGRKAMLAGVHGLRSGAGGSFPPRRLDGFFYLHDKVVFAIEPVVVLSR